ncbi:amidohydrolase family protein [Alsobacter sp. SYSU M60028]|uniref:Amidohydrolase family protein n=1 Tax=Alsobacter ponti TaxID=2962936 RepID=A0ABT1LGY1_9HYPH|nr:amidohydrolase family protein [Alsobacter ponti]MCP8940757.1 amidohydrolase family protein [Alsobacter ponti]
MADILITGGVLIPVDPQRRILQDGAVAIAGDRILAVGPTAEVVAAHDAPTRIDARGKAVLPGLIDGHAHAGHGLIKTMGGGRSDLWYKACESAYTVGSTPEFWHAEAQLAALERLRFGVTTGVSLLGGGDSVMRTDDPAYGNAHCGGVEAVGTRSVVAIGPTRPPHPRTYADWSGGERRDKAVDYDRQMQTCESLIARWHGSYGGRLHMALLTPTLRPEHRESMPAAELREAERQAREVHALAVARGLVFTQDGHGRGSVKMAHELGILGPETLLSHATDLTDEEIGLCAETGARIAHNPSAVASILGRCPVPELLEAGVLVCLGSDATAPDRSADMFRHMQQCMHYHRTHFRDPSWLPPGKVLEMCTIDAARALGLDSEIGSLEPGKKADVILVDLRRPHLYPANMPEFRVTYFANGNDVHTVLVDGRVVLADRRAITVDEDAILDAAQRSTEEMVDRLGLRDLLRTPATFWNHVRATDQVREH